MHCMTGGRAFSLRLPWIFLFLSLSGVAGLGGCSVFRPAPAPSTTPSVSSTSSDMPSAEKLVSGIETRRQTLTSLRGLARVVYKDAQEKGTAKQAIAVSAPDRFRWELFSPIGVAALVTSNGKVLSTYFPGEKVLYRGSATEENVARFTRVLLSPQEIVGLLLGTPVLPPTNASCTVRLDAYWDWYHLHCPASVKEGLDLWFEKQTLRLRRAEMSTETGTVTKRMDLADYRIVGKQIFPFEIVLFDFQHQQQASIFYERVELNPQPADSIFTLASIAGVREIDADAFNR